MFEGQCRRIGQRSAQDHRRGDRALLLVRFEAQSLTQPPAVLPPFVLPISVLRFDLLAIVRAGLRAADTAPLVARALAHETEVGQSTVRIIAAGKAAPAMAQAAAAVLGSRLESGLVVSPTLTAVPFPLRLVQAEHPQPGHGSRSAGTQALALSRSTADNQQLLVLLSGGASSLLAVPAEGLTLDDKRQATAVLLRAGADIHSLNTVRKHLSAIKGGRLAVASRASCLTLVVSDVVGDDLSVIASGPTVPDASTYADAMAVLERFGGPGAFPAPVIAHLREGAKMACGETPKPGDPRLARSRAQVIGGRAQAMKGAAAEAGARGYHVVVLDEAVVGEARLTARVHVEALEQRVVGVPRPCCVISSGETTVTVTGEGQGGRNQEFALAAVERLAGRVPAVVCASVGTDGVDGPTDAAGAVVDPTSWARARAAGLGDPAAFLMDNNSYQFFAAIGDLVQTGPTGTNVGDLQVFLLA